MKILLIILTNLLQNSKESFSSINIHIQMADKRRGRKNVEKRLIDSAAYLVGSVGPNQLTIRDIADHAGVNHAQIHHYFGGKKGLLIATYKQLAFEHVQQLERRNVSPNNLGDEPLPPHL